MRLTAYLLTVGLSLTACAGHGTDDAVPGADVVNGETAYRENCARCHDSGKHGAPRIGVEEDWRSRSTLWQAVLMEHAKQGFLDMPARGGNPELPDDVVNAAAEYMLEQSFPDRPKD